MPIEFRCSGCNQLLRVPETAAGQQAKCPNCSAVQTIPVTSASSPAVPPPPPPMFAGDPANPFAAPSALPGDYYAAGDLAGEFQRTGPPWERDGKSFASYWATFKMVLTSPTDMFRTMRLEGGLGSPILYSMIGSTIGMGVFAIFTNLIRMRTSPRDVPQDEAEFVGFLLALFCCCPFVLVPLLAAARVFIWGGLFHLMLMLVGGARRPVETTLRVVAYSAGSCDVVAVVPFVGVWIALIVHLVYAIIGLMHAHEISGGKATLAVLLPAICCCGLGVLGFVAMIAMFATNLH